KVRDQKCSKVPPLRWRKCEIRSVQKCRRCAGESARSEVFKSAAAALEKVRDQKCSKVPPLRWRKCEIRSVQKCRRCAGESENRLGRGWRPGLAVCCTCGWPFSCSFVF